MREVMAVLLLLIAGILLINPTFINADTDPTDASALRIMFSSLNSPGQLTKWTSTGGDPCGESWRGVTCSGSKVTEIKLSGLGLSGSMGYQLASMTSITTFDMSNNNLGNQIPYALPPNVESLNLAGCGFTGGLPYSISQMTSLKSLNVAHNQIQGQLNDMFGSLSSLTTMDLSFNAMTGDLPQSFSSLSSLRDLYVQNNQFSGTIDVLANLPLKTLNVENNRFTGWIPDQLKNINLQRGGNSWSSGPAPPGRPAPIRPPNNNSNNSNNNSPSGGGGGKKSGGIGGGAIAGILISLLVVGAIVAFFLIKRRKAKKSASDIEKLDEPFNPLTSQPQNTVQELKSIQTPSSAKAFEAPAALNLRPPPFDRTKSFDDDDFTAKPIVTKKVNMPPINAKVYSVADLQIATDSFSSDNLIGEGSHGRVFRAQFDDGKVLAVKKINSSALAGQVSEDFMNIVSAISRLKHPNVTDLVGYCSEHGQHLLVYEFLKNGSLYDFLHLSDEFTKPLTWNNRVQIALGAARALEYLHEVCSPSVVHKNLKSANILLDSELNPRLSDCGLSSLVPENDQASLASGYSAPEVAMSGQYTIKSDVYSFGVIMLELVSGRQAFDSSRARSEQSLVRWATPQLHDIDALAKMVDPTLKGLYPVKSLSRLADVIALCVQPEPEFRPPMSEVVQALVRLVQRANMSKRTVGTEQGASAARPDNADGYDYEP